MAKKYLQLGSILKQLLFSRDIKPAELAREVNLPAPTIHRLVTGKSTRPYKSSLEPVAKYFSVSVNQLVGDEPLPNAEQINRFQKEQSTNRILVDIPLVPWKSIHEISSIDKNTFEKIPFSGSISLNSFATIMPDSSMEPFFSRGCVLIFDLEKNPKDRSFALVYINESKLVIFRQLLIDLDHKYLKPLNPDLNKFKMRLVSDDDKIIAILVESRQIFNDLNLPNL